MCPPMPVPPPADIGLYWTDEELFTSLDKIMHGSPLPGNVIQDVNPYLVQPSLLPDGIWYLIHSEGKKDAEHGFWKPKGEATDIFTNSNLTGWRTTLEFYEGKIPNERRTDWVMQEYGITQKGLSDNSKPNDCRSLCRVFLSDKQIPVNEIAPNHPAQDTTTQNRNDSALSILPYPALTSGQGSTSGSLAKNKGDDVTGPSLPVERTENTPVESLPEYDYVLGGDYLELDDLVGSPSSSSDNTSCLSLTSEEYFDSLALLRDIERGKDASFKYTASASAKSREVIMRSPTLGSLNSVSERKFPAGEIGKSGFDVLGSAIEGECMPQRLIDHTSKQANEGTSNSKNVATPSGTHKSHVGSMKKLKKYLCFV